MQYVTTGENIFFEFHHNEIFFAEVQLNYPASMLKITINCSAGVLIESQLVVAERTPAEFYSS